MNKIFLLCLALSVLLNVVTLVMFMGAFGVISGVTISRPVGISIGLVCVALSSVLCFAGIRLNRK